MKHQILVEKPELDKALRAERNKGREEVWSFVDQVISDPMKTYLIAPDTPEHLVPKIERFIQTMMEAVSD